MPGKYVLVIGNKNYSSWSLRAYLMVRLSGVAFDELRLPFESDLFAQRIGSLSPSRLVPVLIEDGQPVWDTLAIAEYLAERNPTLWPKDDRARAHARCISAEMHSGFSALREQMPMNCRAVGRQVPRRPELDRDIRRIENLWNDARERFHRAGPWLCGTFSAADCMYAPVASRFHTYGVTIKGAAGEYGQRLLEHPDMQEWMAAARDEIETVAREEVGQR